MTRIEFDNIYELCDVAIETYENLKKYDQFADVTIVAKFDDVKEIANYFIREGYDLQYAELEDAFLGDYEDEFYVGIDDEECVWIGKCKDDDDEYIGDVSSVTYILDYCSSAIIPLIKGDVIFEISINDEESYENENDELHCDGNCENCGLREKSDNAEKIRDKYKENKKDIALAKNEVGEKSSHYYVNGKASTKEEFDKANDEIKARFDEFDKLWRRQTLELCNLMDKMNDMRKLFRW